MNKVKKEVKQINLYLKDEEWPFEYIDHSRQIVRAIVFDKSGYFYFLRVERNDDFDKASLIETSGGGVEEREELEEALLRELKEELGAEGEILCKLGVIEDDYNLIHRHNINHYYLFRVDSFGEKNLMEDEIHQFHLSTLKLSYEEAVFEYRKCTLSGLGRLIANRELPVLQYAKRILDESSTKC